MDLPDLPYTFVAPVDMVYRLWKESNGVRIEVRSYRSESLFLSIAGMRNLRNVSLSELQQIFAAECGGQLKPIARSTDLLEFRCAEPASAGHPALVRLLRLDRFPAALSAAGNPSRPERFFLIIAVAPLELESQISALDLTKKAGF